MKKYFLCHVLNKHKWKSLGVSMNGQYRRYICLRCGLEQWRKIFN